VSKTVAIALMLLLTSDAVTLVITESGEPSVPACCMRDGKHHCTLLQPGPEEDTSSPKLSANRCPSFPRAATPTNVSYSAPVLQLAVASCDFSHPASKAQTEALYRFSHSRTREKRGPPALS